MYTYPQGDIVSNMILNILAGLVILIFSGVVYSILYAAFMFIFSGGKDEKIQKGWMSLRYALLGFIFSLIILFSIPGFLRLIKVPGYNYYTPSNIFNTAKYWVKKTINVFSKTSPIDLNSNYEL